MSDDDLDRHALVAELRDARAQIRALAAVLAERDAEIERLRGELGALEDIAQGLQDPS